MIHRRAFIKQARAAGMACSLTNELFSQEKPQQNMIWANFPHLSYKKTPLSKWANPSKNITRWLMSGNFHLKQA
ncbi:MAG: hypothetical protein LBF89_07100 [Bacteroidales bacterium]|jgi:hypothetical protein|nr:hypothetical protein [Bacteroidales bacterium]